MDEEQIQKKASTGIRRKIDTTRLASGTKIGQYVILNEIDRGGMAVVYKSRQLGLDREVALKVLPPSISLQGKFIERFQKEAKSIAQLAHPNIVRIIEVGGDSGIYFIAMEYLEGLNLYKYMVKFEPTVYSVVQIIRQLSDALEYAHGRNIIHRDLKLNNVIMKDNSIPVLIDFGLAKAREADSGLTISGEILGSPSYMSPEQALGQHVDERTDIYSLGIMFYELLSGKNPFFDKRGYQQTIWNVIHGEVKPLREISDWIPRDVETIVMKSMEKDREKRYQTMRALRMDLERFQVGEPIMARSPSFWEMAARLFRKRKALFISSIIIGSLLILFLFYYRYQMSLEKAEWNRVAIKPAFYMSLDAEWAGEKGRQRAPLKFIAMDSPWAGSEDRIQVSSEEYTWICWKQEMRNDIRMDMTVTLNRENSREFGCFIHGANPDNGYTFRFMGGRVLLTKGGRNNIIDAADTGPLEKNRKFRVRVEKNEYFVRLILDDEIKLSFNDYMPLAGAENHSVGFYVDNGGILISDVEIYSMGVPFKTKPIQTAERFFERGYYQDAVEEYRNIIRLYPEDPMAVRAQFKIGLSLMREKEYDKAINEFENILQSRYPDLIPYAMHQIAQCHSFLDNPAKARKIILNIKDKYPNSAAIINILSTYNGEILEDIRRGDEKSAAHARALLDFLLKNFRDRGQFFIQSYLAFGQMYLDNGDYEKAASIFSEIDKGFSASMEQALIAKVRLADLEACNGSLDSAFSMYNDILYVYNLNKPVCVECWMGLGLLNRAQGQVDDAVKCYNVVTAQYGEFREFCAQALLYTGFSYVEKQAPDYPKADGYFRKVVAKYRDADEPMWIARFMLGEITEKDLQAKIDNYMIDYYIGERNRVKGQSARAIQSYNRFRIIIKGNALMTRLAEKQSAYAR